MIFRSIILDCMKHINGERTTASIFHLLVGKRSIQTLQDANIYKITTYYGICRNLQRYQFEQEINRLVDEKHIDLDSKNMARITPIGQTNLELAYQKYPLSQLNGLKFDRISDIFWLRLQLWIQTYTNMSQRSGYFVAITDQKDVQAWVKEHYRINRVNSDKWLTGIYQELVSFLKMNEPFLAQLFVDRLTGYHKIGLTKDQLAKKFNLTNLDTHLYLTVIIHKLLTYINQQELAFLPTFTQDTFSTKKFITSSAEKTYQLIKKGFDIIQIAKIRQLKVNTIEDHVVEIAYIEPAFSIYPYVDQQAINKILLAIQNNNTAKLKQIKKIAGDQFSYFQIRLVLTHVNLQREDDE